MTTIKEFVTYGHVDDDGIMSIYNKSVFKERLQKFFRKTSIELLIRERVYSFSDSRRSYYFAVIVREIQKAWMVSGIVKSLHDVDYEMRDKFLYYEELNHETGLFEKYLHTLKKGDTHVSKQMMKHYCELCIVWCITNLDWAIPYPSEDFNESDMTDSQRKFEGISDLGNNTF